MNTLPSRIHPAQPCSPGIHVRAMIGKATNDATYRETPGDKSPGYSTTPHQ
jgi:hypothetical protein